MKRMRPILSAVLAMLLVLSCLTVPAFAGETGYEPTDAYALNYNGVYDGSKWQYFSPYWPAYTYDGKADYTQSISFTLYNTVSGESFSTYCTDLVVGLDNNSDFRRLNLEDSTYAASAAGLLRSVMLKGFPSVTAEELGRAAGVEGLTVGEAVAATQAAVWKAAHGERLTFTDFCDTIDVDWNPNATEHFEECYAEIESGYASAANEAQIEAHIEKVYNYLISLAPTEPAAAAVSAASFRSWGSPVLSRNLDGTYTVTVEATVDVEMGADDSMTITAVMENDSTFYASASLKNGTNTVTLTVEKVSAAAAAGGVKLAIDGTQTVSDVFLLDAEGGRGTSQSLIGIDDSTLPVHAEVMAQPERELTIYKTTKVANTQGGYDRVPLEGIIFELYLVADWADYVNGKVTLPEAAEYATAGLPDYTIMTDADGRGSFSLTKNGMPDGVYLVRERAHAAIVAPADPFYILLPYTNAEGTGWEYTLTAQPKNDIKGEVDIEKDVIEVGNDEATVDAYKSHVWIVGTTIPVDIADGKEYVISDTLDNRLDFLQLVKVQLETKTGNTEEPLVLEENTDYVVTVTDVDSLAEGKPSDSFTVALTKAGMAKVGAAVGENYDNYILRTYFDAQINANAAMGVEIPNQADLHYKNSVGFEFDVESDIPVVYTAGAKLVKVDAKDQTKPLSGAVFQVYRAATAEEIADESVTKVMLPEVEVPVVPAEFFDNAAMTGEKVTTVTSGADGKVLIYGLAYGTYYLVETQAPAGYNLLSEPVALTLGEVSHLDENTVLVLNNSGAVLPETGGMGTTVFTVAGLLCLAAALLLWTKKRSEA